jgi:hypothetical protein
MNGGRDRRQFKQWLQGIDIPEDIPLIVAAGQKGLSVRMKREAGDASAVPLAIDRRDADVIPDPQFNLAEMAMAQASRKRLAISADGFRLWRSCIRITPAVPTEMAAC